jgi:hypothetical protein
MSKGTHRVFTECIEPEREKEFNCWYSHTHLPNHQRGRGIRSLATLLQLED